MAVKTNITINIVEPGSNVPVPDTGLFTHGIGGTETTIIVSAVLVTVLVILSIVLTTYMYRKHKKQGRNTKLVHLVDSTKAVVKSKKRITMGLSIIALLVSVCTFTAFMLNTNKSNTNAIEGNDTEQQSENTEQTENTNSLTINTESKELTIEVKDQPVFAVLPVQVTVEEATQAGYTLTAYTDNTDLVSTTNPNNKIPMVTVEGDELTSLQDNTWGLALDNEPTSKNNKVYKALSTDPSTPTRIANKDHEATEENDTTTIYYGFYITPDTPYGTYTGAVVSYEAEMNMATVIYNGNGLYFNNNPEQTTNNVEYLFGVTENTEKFSHTPNLNNDGEVIDQDNRMYPTNIEATFVYDFPGAERVHIELTRTGSDSCSVSETENSDMFFSFWSGSHPDYTAEANYESGVRAWGNTTGKYIFGLYARSSSVSTDVTGDAITLAYTTANGGTQRGCSSGYGYYAVITGYDENGNIIYLNGNTPKKGEYKEPAQDLPYIFKGWSEDKDATSATYESKNDIELNLPLTMGETTELYAIWQHATKIHFDGNGSTSGEMQDKIVPAGASTYVSSGNYSREGYSFTGWNAKPDGTGTSYSPYQSFTVASDKSEVITLYAQWVPATTIIYDANGGTGDQQQQTINAGSTSSIWGNWGYFSRDGYAVSHWNTEPDGTGTSYYEGQEFTASDQSEIITLYAQWSPATTIIYDANGGTGSQQRQAIRAGETDSIYSGQIYFRDGYAVSHWNTEPDGTGTSYYGGQNFTAPDQSQVITLYAQWISNVLDTGQTVNAKLKRLAGNSSAEWYTEDTNVTTITRASDLPADFTPTNDNTISINGSTTPVYAWYDTDTTTIYYYTESEKIIMNPDSSCMFFNFRNLSDATSIADWDTSKVTDMNWMFFYVGYNATTWSVGDLSSWDTSKVTNMSDMFRETGYNATTWSVGDISSWDTSEVTSMSGMFYQAGYNATTWSIGDLSSWDTSKVTNMSNMFRETGRNAATWSVGDLSSWDTSKVTDMSGMFSNTGYNATTFSLDLSSWDTSKVTDMSGMFYQAGYNATTWSVIIPQKTGDINNTTSAFYGQDSSVYATPASGKSFTLASQANSNTTNTTESLNSVNNVETPIQGGSSGNRSVYATDDTEDTDNIDNTGLDTTSTPSRQEPLGEYQSSTTTSTKDTNIIIPILIVAAIALGISTLVFLIYKSLRREDE